MGRHAVSLRVQRLDELEALLRARDYVTASELARDLRVSLRTLNRDLAVLRESGVPIEADRGRGGGLRLHRDWSLGRLRLAPEEAIDLLLSIAIAERMNSPMLLRQLGAIKRKIVAAFSEAHHGRIRSLRRRILIGAPASKRVLESLATQARSALSGVAEAFFNQHCIEIEYADLKGATTTRVVEPQFLYLAVPVWYLLTWDRLRGGIRYFRIDRIRSVRILDTRFRLADPRPFLAEAEEGIETL